MTESEEVSTVDEMTVATVAKVEVTRQVIVLAFSIAGTVATIYIARKLQDPDYMSMAKMASALAVKRWSDKQVERFTRLSAKMANVYNGEKL